MKKVIETKLFVRIIIALIGAGLIYYLYSLTDNLLNGKTLVNTYMYITYIISFITFIVLLFYKQVHNKILKDKIYNYGYGNFLGYELLLGMRFSLIIIMIILVGNVFFSINNSHGISYYLYLFLANTYLSIIAKFFVIISYNWIVRIAFKGAIGIFFDKNIAKTKSILVFIFTSISTFLKKTYDME
jgi:hypothetical protein